MYYTYVLKSIKNGRLYTGSTGDLKQRVEEHNMGIGGKFTRNNRPHKLIFYEAFLAREDAVRQEKFYKTGYGKKVLKEKIKYSLDS